MKRLLAFAALAAPLLFAPPALADDEASSHTAQLVGKSSDTLGVTLSHDRKAGWQARIRARPGAKQETIALRFLPADHAHYHVVVGPDRAWLAFITESRPQLHNKDIAVWLVTPGGKVTKTWSFGDIMSDKERESLPRSISHTRWLTAQPSLAKGTVTLSMDGRKVRIVPAKKRLLLK